MNPSPLPLKPPTPKRVNVRRPEIMEQVQGVVENHYSSPLVEKIRENGGELKYGNTTIRLARQFGFCYGVERAINLAYAARKVFQDQPLHLLGEIIHNPEVNRQLKEMGVITVTGPYEEKSLEALQEGDVVIVPAFGAATKIMDYLESKGCVIVDTTCGDVMSVWKRVRQYAKEGRTSIIHGKAQHEETLATASRAMGVDGKGHYLVILTLEDTDFVCNYIRYGGDRAAFLERFRGAHSEGFDPDFHLRNVGVANQTTMMQSETEELQRRIQQAVIDRDGEEMAKESFRVFDTICGATQERQDSLFEMLKQPLDMLMVVGGYNSSNTTHLVEIGQEHLPTFFIRDASCLSDLQTIIHFDLHEKQEVKSYAGSLLDPARSIIIGITAGASCPNNLIEATLRRLFELRGIEVQQLLEESIPQVGE